MRQTKRAQEQNALTLSLESDGALEPIATVLETEPRKRTLRPSGPTERWKDGLAGLTAQRLANRQDLARAWEFVPIEVIEDGDQESPGLRRRRRPFDLQLHTSQP